MTDIVAISWDFALKLARNGDPSLLAAMLREEHNLPSSVRETLAEIVEGKTSLTRRRGTKSRSDYLRASDMSSMQDYLQRVCRLSERDAVEIVAAHFRLSASRVRAVVRKYRSTIPRPRVVK